MLSFQKLFNQFFFTLAIILLALPDSVVAQDPLVDQSNGIFTVKDNNFFIQVEAKLGQKGKATLQDARQKLAALGEKAKYQVAANRIMDVDSKFLLGIIERPPIDINEIIEQEKNNEKLLDQLGPDFPKIRNSNILESFVDVGPCHWETSILTPVKDQLSCGSCWAFSAAATWEHSYRKIYGASRTIPNIAEEELLNCASDDDGINAGDCGGGWSDKAFQFMVRNPIAHELDYPYSARNESCRRIPGIYKSNHWGTVAHISSVDIGFTVKLPVVEFPKKDEIKTYIRNYGAVVTYLKAGVSSFLSYGGGVLNEYSSSPEVNYKSCCSEVPVDHAVTIVGWCDFKNAWIIKNSWGEDWGPYGGYAYVDYDSYNIGKYVYYVYPESTEFQKTEVPGLSDLGKGKEFYGGQWGDYNNDGNSDLMISGISATDRSTLLKNNGDGTFTKSPYINYPFISGRNASWGDYNNDGNLDLFAPGGSFNPDSSVRSYILKNTGNEKFEKIPLPRIKSNFGLWSDTDKDGDLDLITDGGDGVNFLTLYRNDGNDQFTEILSFNGTTSSMSFYALASDLNNDGYPDIFTSGDGARRLYFGGPDNVFIRVSDDPILTTEIGRDRGASVGDFDQDGDQDIVLLTQDYDKGHKFFFNNGQGSFVNKTSLEVLGTNLGAGRGSAVSDFDNDGFIDLVLNSGFELFIYSGTPEAKFKKKLVLPIRVSSFTGAAVADYNNDGFPDIFTSSFGLENFKLFSNSQNGNNWIQIKLQGRVSNRNGFGAKLYLYSNGTKQFREHVAGNGFGIQNSEVINFGLGVNQKIDSIVVIWPSGKKQVIKKPLPNQKLLVVENIMSDREGSNYKTTILAGREWTSENLRVNYQIDNSLIQHAIDPGLWANLNAGGWSHLNNNPALEPSLGKLYNYFAVEAGICPSGWEIPTQLDWQNLSKILPTTQQSISALAKQNSWADVGNLNNDFGFSATPGGLRTADGSFQQIPVQGNWWATSQRVFQIKIENQNLAFTEFAGEKKIGASVRCVRIRKPQQILFSLPEELEYGMPDFFLSAKASSGNIVQYKSLDTSKVVIDRNQLIIRGTGIVSVKAFEPGDTEYQSAEASVKQIIIKRARATLKASNQFMVYGANIPLLNFFSSNLKYDESTEVVEINPKITCIASNASDVGTYTITIEGASAKNYEFEYEPGILEIRKAELKVRAKDLSIQFGSEIPSLDIIYEGFKNNQDDKVLDSKPQANTIAKKGSPVGTYTISVSGGTDNNYAYTYESGNLIIVKAEQQITFNQPENISEDLGVFTINATINSDLPIQFSTDDTDKLKIEGNKVTILKPGRVTITASQTGDSNHSAAKTVSQSFCILPKKIGITSSSLGSESTILTSSLATNNQWYLNGTAILLKNGFQEDANQRELKIEKEGEYQVRTIIDGCEGILSDPFRIIITGLEDETTRNQIQIFPNPTSESITIKIPSQIKILRSTMLIKDIQGNLVGKSEFDGTTAMVDIHHLPKGSYILAITNSDLNATVRFVIK